LSIQQSSLAFAGGEEDKNVFYVGKQDTTTDIFELLSGIFAAILFVLSLRAYRKLKIKGMLFVSAAFGIFAARTIVIETRDLYIGVGESSALQSVLSLMFLMAIVLFFIAILQREKIKPKPPQPGI
jgi:prolipoprotein diacylglyceryltransferase